MPEVSGISANAASPAVWGMNNRTPSGKTSYGKLKTKREIL
jgi:hypothetical protein